jgi:hypothetical protein
VNHESRSCEITCRPETPAPGNHTHAGRSRRTPAAVRGAPPLRLSRCRPPAPEAARTTRSRGGGSRRRLSYIEELLSMDPPFRSHVRFRRESRRTRTPRRFQHRRRSRLDRGRCGTHLHHRNCSAPTAQTDRPSAALLVRPLAQPAPEFPPRVWVVVPPRFCRGVAISSWRVFPFNIVRRQLQCRSSFHERVGSTAEPPQHACGGQVETGFLRFERDRSARKLKRTFIRCEQRFHLGERAVCHRVSIVQLYRTRERRDYTDLPRWRGTLSVDEQRHHVLHIHVGTHTS